MSFAHALAVAVPLLLQFVVFFRWLHRRLRDDEIHRAFVRDVATNHLPHIYDALHRIAEHQGIQLGLPPMVRFVDIDGSSGKGSGGSDSGALDSGAA